MLAGDFVAGGTVRTSQDQGSRSEYKSVLTNKRELEGLIVEASVTGDVRSLSCDALRQINNTMLRLRTLALGRRSFQRSLTTSTSSSSSSSSSSAPEKSVPLPPVVEPSNPNFVQTVPQAPNMAARWSTSQNPRPAPGSNPRFEQVEYSLQPAPLSAMEMVANEPIIMSDARIAVCDGGEQI